MLATVYAYLESRDLLHLFPHAVPPQLPECVSWREPLSPEAAVIMARMSDKSANTRPGAAAAAAGGESGMSGVHVSPYHSMPPPAIAKLGPPDASEFGYGRAAVGSQSSYLVPSSQQFQASQGPLRHGLVSPPSGHSPHIKREENRDTDSQGLDIMNFLAT